ncbi:MAG: pilus assembly protein [Actinomycetota bacterium]|nr:pilus assembly protein [Actinomycetota bacterium]
MAAVLGHSRRESGMVTAEAALVIPMLLLVAVVCGWIVAVGAAQVRLIDAAREGARLAGRGEPPAVVEAAIEQTGPDGTTGQVSPGANTVTVHVSARVEPGLPLLDLLPAVTLDSSATSALEVPDG